MPTRTITSVIQVVALLLSLTLASGPLYSADLQHDTIYQIMVDRFHDGDTSNNATGAPFRLQMDEELDMHYMKGGDWQGVIDKLPYIQSLGFSAIWISPVADPQLWRLPAPDGSQFPAAYHGYNAHDPNRANRYFGHEDPKLSREKLKELVDAAHDAGIKVIIDVVPNHVGDFMIGSPDNPHYLNGGGVTGTQYQPVAPFNDLSLYHQEGETDWDFADTLDGNDKMNYLENHDLDGLDDIDYDNSTAKDLMFASIKGWFDYLGADGARVDAAKSMFPADVHELETLLGVPTFGENFDGDVDFVEKWLGPNGEWGMLDFPLFFAIVQGIGWGQSFEGNIAQVLAQDHKYDGWENHMVTFIDNHDRNRFQAETMGDARKLRNALTFLYAVRGVPVVFQGTETEKGNHNGIYLTGSIKDSWNRWPMVEKDAQGNVLVDHFSQNTLTRQHMAQLNQLRANYAALRVGKQREMWKANNLYGFSRRVDSGAGVGQEVIAVFSNTESSQTQTIPLRAESTIPTGATLVNVFDSSDSITVSGNRDVTIQVSAQSHKLYAYVTDTQPPTVPSNLTVTDTGATSISLAWQAASDNQGVHHYRIYRDGVMVAESSTTQFSNTGLNPQTRYDFQVTAVDEAANESAFSNTVTGETETLVQLSATVYYKKGFADPNIHYLQANGRWTNAPGQAMADSEEFPGYSVSTILLGESNQLRAVFNDGRGTWDNNGGNDYFFGAGNSTYDNGVISVGKPNGQDTTPPTVPSNLAARGIQSDGFTLEWSAATDASGIDEYQIFRNGQWIANTNGLTWVVTDLNPDTTYQFQVSAIDNAGNTSERSDNFSVRTLPANGKVTLNLVVNNASTEWGQNVYIVGNIPELGNWDPAKAVGPGNADDYPDWRFTISDLPSNTPIKFKAIKKNGDWVQWQGDDDREMVTPSQGSFNLTINW